jgi:hypothetical protein
MLSFNKFNYTHSSPVMGVDPNGKMSLIAVSFVAIGITVTGLNLYNGYREGGVAGAVRAGAEDLVYWAIGAGAAKAVYKLSRAAMGVFAGAQIGKTLILGAARSSNVLRRNLEISMGKAPFSTNALGNQAHHLVAEVFPEGKLAMNILRKYKIDVNSPLNGVFLPGCGHQGTAGIIGMAVHCGQHNQAYERYVLATLFGAKDKIDVINRLSKIREDLLFGMLDLNKRGSL